MPEDVERWLASIGLQKLAAVFAEHQIDLDAAQDLTDGDLRELGIPMGPRKKLLRAVAALTNGQVPVPLPVPPPAVDGTTQQQSAAGERRQVTVLFADITGFTQLSNELGAEGTHALLNRYFAAVDDIVQSYGGTVDKHIGDSVMAVFGAPVAHTNDPERAVRAALAIQEIMPSVSGEVNRALQVHIGVASGQVVASGVGGEAHYTVTGESVNLASRLTDTAGPGEALISRAVHRAVESIAECDDFGEVSLKGIAEPVRTFALRGVRTKDSLEMFRPFVGRRAELQQFSAVVMTCAETGAGQAILVRGEAGIGKTRLTEQFESIAGDRGFDCHRTLVLDFGVGKGQDAIRGLVRHLLAIPLRSDKAARAAAAERIYANGLLDRAMAIYVNDLLDLPQSPELRFRYDAMDNAKRNQGNRETVAALITALSRSRPVFLVIEDVHWADNLILEHLAELTRSVADQPVILVMTSRIEGDPIDHTWRLSTAATPLTTIDLSPLRHDDAMALAAEFFDATTQFAMSCVERADGNPLFLEQLLRSAETASKDAVPGSVQSIVQARMDALEPLDKQAILAASVLGQRFSLDALRNLIESPNYTCTGLVERYLVRPDGDDYLFAHALVREGVYSSLLTSRRTELHRAAAVWYDGNDLALCAEHLDRADDSAAAAAYCKAAEAQAAALHFEQALSLSERGVELAEDSTVKCNLMCLRGDALRNTGATEDSIAAFEKALQEAGDDEQRSRAWIGMAGGLRVADRQTLALEVLDKAEAAAAQHQLLEALSQVHYLRGNVYFPLGNIDGCLAEHEKALRFAREVGSTVSEALALGGLGDAHYLRGHMRTACDQFRACVELCREHGYGRIEVANRHMVGWTRIYLVEFSQALQDALESIKLAAEVSHRRAELLGLMLAGTVELAFENTQAAREHLERGLELSRAISAGNFEIQTLARLAQADAAEGNMAEARSHARQAVDLTRIIGTTFFGPIALAIWASLSEDNESRREALKEAEGILDSGCVAHNHFWFGEVAIEQSLCAGEWDAALHFADRLEAYMQDQPLEWPSYICARGRALAAWGRGDRSPALLGEIERLKASAEHAGLKTVIPALDRALASVP